MLLVAFHSQYTALSIFIGVYLATFLAITTASIISTVVVLHVHHMGTRKVPLFVKRVVFDIMARMLFMNSLAYKYGTSSCWRDVGSPMETSMTSVMMTSSRNPSLLNSKNHYSTRLSPTLPYNKKSAHHNGRANGSGMKKSFSITEDRLAQHLLLNRNFVLEEILMYVKAFTQEKASNELIEATRMEWIAVAKVLDRFFMCLFMSSIVCSSFFILILLPMSKIEMDTSI